jgi:hypothetical protein
MVRGAAQFIGMVAIGEDLAMAVMSLAGCDDDLGN